MLKILKPLDVNSGLKCKCDLIEKNSFVFVLISELLVRNNFFSALTFRVGNNYKRLITVNLIVIWLVQKYVFSFMLLPKKIQIELFGDSRCCGHHINSSRTEYSNETGFTVVETTRNHLNRIIHSWFSNLDVNLAILDELA